MRHLNSVLAACSFMIFASGCLQTTKDECDCPATEPDYNSCALYFYEHNIAVNCDAEKKLEQQNAAVPKTKPRDSSKSLEDKVAVEEKLTEPKKTLEDKVAVDEKLTEPEKTQENKDPDEITITLNNADNAANETGDSAPKPNRKTYPNEDDGIGYLTITSDPWSIVTVNDVRIGDTPIKLQKVNYGSQTIEFFNPEKKISQRKRVSVNEGEVMEIHIDFTNQIVDTRQYDLKKSGSNSGSDKHKAGGRKSDGLIGSENSNKRRDGRPRDNMIDLPF
ncbi:MAG: hypothetical protein IJU23_11870 [Proteobacteria bacterium]|nr:hypothetical protein [Pseudomonadota bacterium]